MGVPLSRRWLGFRKRQPRGPDLRCEHLQHHEVQCRLHQKQVFKLAARHEPYLGAFASDTCQSVRFIRNESREAKQCAWTCAETNDRPARSCFPYQGSFAT